MDACRCGPVARDSAAATRIYLTLRAQGERVESLIYWVTRRLREALSVAQRLEHGCIAGEP